MDECLRKPWVMFSQMSVILFKGRSVSMWPLPMMHWTSLYTTLQPCPPDMGPHCKETPPTASDIWWPSLKTCSKLFTSGHPPLVLTSGGYWSMYGQHKWMVHILLECFLVFLLNLQLHLVMIPKNYGMIHGTLSGRNIIILKPVVHISFN